MKIEQLNDGQYEKIAEGNYIKIKTKFGDFSIVERDDRLTLNSQNDRLNIQPQASNSVLIYEGS